MRIASIGELSITKLTENSVSFQGKSEDGQTVWRGDVDRFSGLTVVTVWRHNEVLVNYNLTCTRPEPLFQATASEALHTAASQSQGAARSRRSATFAE